MKTTFQNFGKFNFMANALILCCYCLKHKIIHNILINIFKKKFIMLRDNME